MAIQNDCISWFFFGEKKSVNDRKNDHWTRTKENQPVEWVYYVDFHGYWILVATCKRLSFDVNVDLEIIYRKYCSRKNIGGVNSPF